MSEDELKNETIQVYARIRPPDRKKSRRHGTAKHEIQSLINDNYQLLKIIPPKEGIGGYVNNSAELYEYKFKQIFGMKSTQEEIFETLALPVIDNVLEGYNGTIFAYGQTNSGKTYTMTGGASNYNDRGLIPRTISEIYNRILENENDYSYIIRISYLEIYNNNGYDLLDPGHENKFITDLPKIKMFEDENGILTLSNIELNTANNEEDALNLLFIGDTNRMICSTPNNDTSSRSHCIFTLFIESRKLGNDKIKKSKLHLVDLAGSERVFKSNITGNILNESKYINSSLHFLELVIVALYNKTKKKDKNVHIPYRNSMITSFLRDSLGGNCKTCMISTLSLDNKCIGETLSTCRFSQRVSLIKTNAVINEILDPNLMISRLKVQIKSLKDELNVCRGKKNINFNKELTDDEIIECKNIIQSYLNFKDVTFPFEDSRKILQCFVFLREYTINKSKYFDNKKTINNDTIINEQNEELLQQINTLKHTIKEKDNEIQVLTNLLKQYTEEEKNKNSFIKLEEKKNGNGIHPVAKIGAKNYDDMIERNKAFLEYRKQSKTYQIIESSKTSLRAKFIKAKSLGLSLNETRNKMNQIKSLLEKIKIDIALDKMDNKTKNINDSLLQEKQYLNDIENEKQIYRKYYIELKNLKVEIENEKTILQQNRHKIQLEFEKYWQNIYLNNYNNNLNSNQILNSYYNEIYNKNKNNKNNKSFINPKILSNSNEILNSNIKNKYSNYSNSEYSNNFNVPQTGDPIADKNIYEFYQIKKQIEEASEKSLN